MIKSVIVIFCLLFFQSAVGQTKKIDTVIYYMQQDGLAANKTPADYVILVFPSGLVADKALFTVQENFTDGRIKLLGKSSNQNLPLIFEGKQTMFFKNGQKMQEAFFENGNFSGDVIEYYPNGKVFNIKSYVKTATEETEVLLRTCKDSTGKILAQNGNGEWIKYIDNGYQMGTVVDGREQGEWDGRVKGEDYIWQYKDGGITSSYPGKPGTIRHDTVIVEPGFPGGKAGLEHYLQIATRYPAQAKKNNIEGTVLVSFVVTEEGNLINVKVWRRGNRELDDEAIRVIKNSPKWIPGTEDSVAVKAIVTVPIKFSLNQ